MTLRVVQWATGNHGVEAIRAVLDRPRDQQSAMPRKATQSSKERGPSEPICRTSIALGTLTRSSKLATDSTGNPSASPTGS